MSDSQVSDDLDLGQLFAKADEIGDKYLSAEEIQQWQAKLTEVRKDLWLSLTDAEVDEPLARLA